MSVAAKSFKIKRADGTVRQCRSGDYVSDKEMAGRESLWISRGWICEPEKQEVVEVEDSKSAPVIVETILDRDEEY